MCTRRQILLGLLFAPLGVVASGCADGSVPLGFGRSADADSGQAAESEGQVESFSTFPEALAEARQADKPLLVFFSTPECIYCRQMLERTFRDRQIVRLAESFVCVRVEAADDPQICEDFHIQAFPTVQFITSDGAPLNRVLGKKEPETFAVQMQVALQGTSMRTAYRRDSIQR